MIENLCHRHFDLLPMLPIIGYAHRIKLEIVLINYISRHSQNCLPHQHHSRSTAASIRSYTPSFCHPSDNLFQPNLASWKMLYVSRRKEHLMVRTARKHLKNSLQARQYKQMSNFSLIWFNWLFGERARLAWTPKISMLLGSADHRIDKRIEDSFLSKICGKGNVASSFQSYS